ncbi:hypothetical protein [Nocardioides sp. Leaf285]|uniref:hypothetical protein n=1 Tax=Nocardioides sp. Leaf285 TaxID=1736322 RepID=UPI000B081949|nr:hypothetical protein [Nocardioides sp. Leaf285]
MRPSPVVSAPAESWDRFCSALPGLLAPVGVSRETTEEVADDVRARAAAYAAVGSANRRLLRAACLDDVAAFEPAEAPIGVRAEAAVVLRNGAVEAHHAAGRFSDEALVRLTYAGCAPLNAWLREHNSEDGSFEEPSAGPFAALARYPRARAVLAAMAMASDRGGRAPIAKGADRIGEERAEVPDLATAREAARGVSSGVSSTVEGAVTRSGLDGPEEGLVDLLEQAALHGTTLAVPALSRLSRDAGWLGWMLEYLAAHGATVLTTNFLLRSERGEVFARRTPLVGADNRTLFATLEARGLSGVHTKTARETVQRLGGTVV